MPSTSCTCGTADRTDESAEQQGDVPSSGGAPLFSLVMARARRWSTADYVVADFASAASIRQAVRTVVSLHGRLDVAFNNAGIVTPAVPLVDVSEADFVLKPSATDRRRPRSREQPLVLPGERDNVLRKPRSAEGNSEEDARWRASSRR